MKKYFLLLFLVIFNFGCEKVIEIDLNFNEQKYVIDATAAQTHTNRGQSRATPHEQHDASTNPCEGLACDFEVVKRAHLGSSDLRKLLLSIVTRWFTIYLRKGR